MRRRDFIPLFGGAVASSALPALGQSPEMRTVGFLRSTPAASYEHIIKAFVAGLADEGFVEGKTVKIEYRFADNRRERLPGLAADLVRQGVEVIVGNSFAAEAATAITQKIPVVFVTSDDPVARGLVAALNRPEGNATGITFFGGGELGAKRIELLRELLPTVMTFAVLQDPTWPGSRAKLPDIEASARTLGRQIVVVSAKSEAEFTSAFERIAQTGAGALIVIGSPVFTSRRQSLAALTARFRAPAIYDVREHVEAGGLISYSASLVGAYRQAGIYAAKIMKGDKPADLPVLRPSKFELVVNLKAAKALGITIPESILLRADDIIE